MGFLKGIYLLLAHGPLLYSETLFMSFCCLVWFGVVVFVVVFCFLLLVIQLICNTQDLLWEGFCAVLGNMIFLVVIYFAFVLASRQLDLGRLQF